MTPFGRRNRIHYYSSATRNLWNYNTVACNYTHANYQLPRMTTEEWQATCIDVFRRTETPRGSKQAGRDNDGHGLLTTRSNRFRRSVAAGTDAATTATTANCCCSCWTRSDCTLQSPRQIIRPIVGLRAQHGLPTSRCCNFPSEFLFLRPAFCTPFHLLQRLTSVGSSTRVTRQEHVTGNGLQNSTNTVPMS